MDRAEVERRSAAFAIEVFRLCLRVRKQEGGSRAANQLQDAASSVGANYRAAGRARSHAEFTSKMGVANEEADETVYWLEFVTNTRLADGPAVARLVAEANELRAIIAASYATARHKTKARKG